MIARVVLISLESWDGTWRRNQHLALRLTADAHVQRLLFIAPAEPLMHRGRRRPLPGVDVLTPHLVVPRRLGGRVLTAAEVRLRACRGADLLWVNDPLIGASLLSRDIPVIYDVTDDWRSYPFGARVRRRYVVAEDRLAGRATTIVCSDVLRRRWRERYGVEAHLIRNGVDEAAYQDVPRLHLKGKGPHVGYIGTLQSERLDIDLVMTTAASQAVGTLHLVGPDALDDDSRRRLMGHPKVVVHPPLDARLVPQLLCSLDLLLSPHLINDFTLSLDAIKSYEYTMSGRPVVATPTSGFQHLQGFGVRIASGDDFPSAVAEALSSPEGGTRPVPGSDWSSRASEFAGVLKEAVEGARQTKRLA